MSSHLEENRRSVTVVITGFNTEALEKFTNTLAQLVAVPFVCKVLEGKLLYQVELIQQKCFLVMPHGSRTLVYQHGDSTSMYEEITHMCGPDPDKWTMERGNSIYQRLIFHSKDLKFLCTQGP